MTMATRTVKKAILDRTAERPVQPRGTVKRALSEQTYSRPKTRGTVKRALPERKMERGAGARGAIRRATR